MSVRHRARILALKFVTQVGLIVIRLFRKRRRHSSGYQKDPEVAALRGRAKQLKSVLNAFANSLTSARCVAYVGGLAFGNRHSARQFQLTQAKSIVIVRQDGIGDFIFTTAFIRELRRNCPGAYIVLGVAPDAFGLAQHCPYVNEVHVIERIPDWWSPSGRVRLSNVAKCFVSSRRLTAKVRPQVAFLPRIDTDGYGSTYVAFFTSARHRFGFSEGWTSEKRKANVGFDRLLSHPYKRGRTKSHEVDVALDLLRHAGGTVENVDTELWLTKNDRAYADGVWNLSGIGASDRVVAIAPSGGTSILKQWPAESFVRLGRWLHEEFGFRVLVVGGAEATPIAKAILAACGNRGVDVSGTATLRETAAVLAKCSLLVANDSAPMHIGSAVRVPVVALFGASCDHRFGPRGRFSTVVNHRFSCAPCRKFGLHVDRCHTCPFDRPLCLWAIEVSEVQAAISLLLNQTSTPSQG